MARKTKLQRQIDECDLAISQHNEIVKDITSLRNKLHAQTPLRCESNNMGPGCGKRTQIRDLTYLQTYHYSNEAYAEGWEADYKNAHWLCPCCGHRNRAYSSLTTYNKVETGPRPWVLALKEHFGKQEKEYVRY